MGCLDKFGVFFIEKKPGISVFWAGDSEIVGLDTPLRYGVKGPAIALIGHQSEEDRPYAYLFKNRFSSSYDNSHFSVMDKCAYSYVSNIGILEKDDTYTKLFEDDTLIGGYWFIKGKMIFTGITQDSNADQRLSCDDAVTLFIYDLETRALQSVAGFDKTQMPNFYPAGGQNLFLGAEDNFGKSTLKLHLLNLETGVLSADILDKEA